MKKFILAALLLTSLYGENYHANTQIQNTQENNAQTQDVKSKELEDKDKESELQKLQKELQYQRLSELEKEEKRWFGRNRSGVLIGFGIPNANDGIFTQYYSFRIGYQYFKNNTTPFGLRAYYDYTFSYDLDSYSFNHRFDTQNINIDALVEWHIPKTFSYIGGFFGVGIGNLKYNIDYIWSSSIKGSANGISAFLNAGVAITTAGKHRWEFYSKIPLVTKYYLDGDFAGYYYELKPFYGFSYQYTF
ncbi:hypothetical protein CQA49_04090 [Helicobacter sp. MIT 00-7814]|uniref:outer membrane beta-barrel protein n=1 Tax=unclassified Helicobacter TaxID=2593540 RepID=UPI000E1F83A7|nr:MULTISPECIES: outer membrane beta-barrel protein [unclassified Helicobacter]RDU55018.1 hypothetical protein CQA49_04090 [Helicobacter sp. MIT 00-7814]RDU55951.1 hypothetical protein CQA37_03405 [Helicobacter sp. MIT 99-10781]